MKLSDLKNKKFIRIFLSIMFLILFIVDVALAFWLDNYPTVSRIVFDLTPQYLAFIWFFGLITSNIFFRRIIPEVKYKLPRIIILFIIGGALFLLGNNIHETEAEYLEEIKCANINSYQQKLFFGFTYTRPLCMKDTNDGVEDQKLNCKELDCGIEHEIRSDLTVSAKFILLFFGLLCGYYLWPDETTSP